ncbi:MAG TPA: ATP-binding cassette domain-containing protein, partial [Candidatus Hydrogenedentes bacterium]|nr:ATP-binding cassette domain-containing protein [Candidatus Hydrogenedentota bacterium]
YLRFVANARGLSGNRLRERTEAVIDACGLRPMFRKVIRELSKGYKQRTALAQALIHDPEVIILDEPTSGLDPHQILEIRHLINALAKDKTVILSTHILQEVEATADRIVIINQGRIVGDGTIDE